MAERDEGASSPQPSLRRRRQGALRVRALGRRSPVRSGLVWKNRCGYLSLSTREKTMLARSCGPVWPRAHDSSDGSPFAALLTAHASVDSRRDGAAGPGEKAAIELLVGAVAGRREVGRALLLLTTLAALFLLFSCAQVLSSSCCSLCSSPARAVHPREACIHSDLIEDKLCALISFVLGATLAADGGGRSRCCCSLPGSLCCPCCSREAAATLCRCCSSSTSRAGRRVVTPAALQATTRPQRRVAQRVRAAARAAAARQRAASERGSD